MSRGKPWRDPEVLRNAAHGMLTEVLYVAALVVMAVLVTGLLGLLRR